MQITDNLFAGKLVRLAAQQPSDHAIMAKWTEDAEYSRLLEFRPIYPRNAEFWAEDEKRRKEDRDAFNFQLRTLEGDNLIGFLHLHISWSNQVCFLAIAIGEPDYRGRGYGSDALRLGINYSFRELNLYKVQLGVFSYNTRAIRTYEKIGFVREAVQRAMLYRDGQRFDMIEMGILRPEWEAQLTNYEPNG